MHERDIFFDERVKLFLWPMHERVKLKDSTFFNAFSLLICFMRWEILILSGVGNLCLAVQDVSMRIASFCQQGPRAICVISAVGLISNVTLQQPNSSGGTLTYEVCHFVYLLTMF